MRSVLLVVVTIMVLAIFATPAFCARPDNRPTVTSSLDGALSERWFEYKNVHDIIGIARQEMFSNELMDETVGYGKEMKDAYALEPAFVQSLDEKYPSYYMVSFMGKETKINVLCIVGVKDGKASLMEVYGLNPEIKIAVYPPVVESEAKGIAAAHGKAVGQAKGKLVFKFSEQCLGPALPAWDLGGGVKVSQKGELFGDFTDTKKIKD